MRKKKDARQKCEEGKKIVNSDVQGDEADSSSSQKPDNQQGRELKKESDKKPNVPLSSFLRTAQDNEIERRFIEELSDILKKDALTEKYCLLALLKPYDSISTFALDRIYTALMAMNPKKDKPVLLMLLSRGGSIEPAYQISKLCKSFSFGKFLVTVPRRVTLAF